VLTGVTDPATLLSASPEHRPDLLAQDAAGLLSVHPPVTEEARSWRCGAWSVGGGEAAGVLVLRHERVERPGDDGLDGLRALCVAAWAGSPDRAADVRVLAEGPPAVAAVERWHLPAG
jgi:hypothetical protein